MQRNLLEILLNQTGIRLYLQFPIDLEPNGRTIGVPNQSEKVNTIWFRFDLIRFRKDFSVCIYTDSILFSKNDAFKL